MEKDSIIWLLKQLNLFLERDGKRVMKECKLSPSQIFLMNYLLDRQEGPAYATDLHSKLGISKSALSATIKSLKQAGYLALVSPQGDDRKKEILLTPKAHAMHQQIDWIVQKRQEVLCQGLSPEQLACLKESLATMLQNLKQTQIGRNVI